FAPGVVLVLRGRSMHPVADLDQAVAGVGRTARTGTPLVRVGTVLPVVQRRYRPSPQEPPCLCARAVACGRGGDRCAGGCGCGDRPMSPKPLIAHVLYRLDTGGMERIVVSLINASQDRYRHAVIALAGFGD